MAALQGLLARLRRIASFDFSEFVHSAEEASIERSIAVAVISMFAFGLGGWLWWVRSNFGDEREIFLKSVVFGGAMSFALWLAWLIVVYALVQRLSRRVVPMELLVREAGMANAPLALGVLMALPLVSFAAGLLAIAAWVASMQRAVERASGLRGTSILVANLAGFALWAGVLSLLATGSHPLAPGPFLAESVWEALADRAAALIR
jgi:hypothetical protein